MSLAPGLAVRPSLIDGKGCFATICFPRGRKIAEYTGERISRREVARRVRTRRQRILRICGRDRAQINDDAIIEDARDDGRCRAAQRGFECDGRVLLVCERDEGGWRMRGRRGAAADGRLTGDEIEAEPVRIGLLACAADER